MVLVQEYVKLHTSLFHRSCSADSEPSALQPVLNTAGNSVFFTFGSMHTQVCMRGKFFKVLSKKKRTALPLSDEEPLELGES